MKAQLSLFILKEKELKNVKGGFAEVEPPDPESPGTGEVKSASHGDSNGGFEPGLK